MGVGGCSGWSSWQATLTLTRNRGLCSFPVRQTESECIPEARVCLQPEALWVMRFMKPLVARAQQALLLVLTKSHLRKGR